MRLETIAIEDIEVVDRTREELGDIESLARSIKEDSDGGLITPIAVHDTSSMIDDPEDPDAYTGKLRYRLLAGGRRIEACKLLNMTGVPARIFDGPMRDIDMLVIELSENLYRKDLTWQEDVAIKAKIHKYQTDKHGIKKSTSPYDQGWSQANTARLLGESPGGLSQDLDLARFADKVPALLNVKNKSDAIKMIKSAGIAATRRLKSEAIQKEIETQQDKIKKDLVNRFIVLEAKKDLTKSGFFEGIKDIPNNSIDFIEIDPPYGIDIKELRKSEGANVGIAEYNEVPGNVYESFINKTLKEAHRILSPTGWLILWFGPEPWFEKMYKLIKNNGLYTRRIPGIWVKPAGQTMQPSHYLANTYEMFYYVHKGDAQIVKQGRSNTFTYPGVPSRIHPTERPIEMIQDIIETFCEPGGKGIVPFLGSGNTLLAMANVGMRGLGWELSKNGNCEYKDSFVIKVKEGEIGKYASY